MTFVPDPVPLARHQEDALRRRRAMEYPVYNGIQCSVCGSPLIDCEPGLLARSDPPALEVRCLTCNWKGLRWNLTPEEIAKARAA